MKLSISFLFAVVSATSTTTAFTPKPVVTTPTTTSLTAEPDASYEASEDRTSMGMMMLVKQQQKSNKPSSTNLKQRQAWMTAGVPTLQGN